MKPMRVAILVGCLWVAAGAGAQPAGPAVKTVYLLPMVSGFEQFLAQELVSQGVLEVVADPAQADAFFTDHIGARFEEELRLLLKAREAGTGEAAETEQSGRSSAEQEPLRVLAGSFGRGRGTIFLVRQQDKRVVWSTYQPIRQATAAALHKAARDVVARLKKQLSGKS